MSRWELGRRPELDGLRGIAILLVLACHANIPELYGAGAAGVAVFFTLSGFLISALLLEEHTERGEIDLRGFYSRRARRLFPALAVNVLAISGAGLFLRDGFFAWMYLLPVAGYFGNWVQALGGSVGGFAGTWSLAVEEQFYLIWPLVLLICVKRGPRTTARIAGIGALVSLLIRLLLWRWGATPARLYYGSDTSAVGLLGGSLLAARMRASSPSRSLPRAAIAACVVTMLLGLTDDHVFAADIVPAAAPAVTAALIWCVCRGATRTGWLSSPWLVWCGRRSYGLYLWNCPINVYLTVQHPELAWPVHALALLGVTLPLCVLSWRFVELPFLRLRITQPAPR